MVMNSVPRKMLMLLLLCPACLNGLSLETTRRSFFQAPTAFVLSSIVISEHANAYERRDVGDESRSAITAAMNEQAYQTNNRLEASGFKLDTREEEQERLSNALASFSYDDSTNKKRTGYRSTRKPEESQAKSK